MSEPTRTIEGANMNTQTAEPGENTPFIKSAAILIRSRLEPLSGWSWNTAAACFIAGRGSPPLIPSLLAVVSMILIALSVYIYNDVVEAEKDKMNPHKKNRPLPSGVVSQKDALSLVYLSGICGLVILFLVNVYSFVCGLAYFGVLIAYSHPETCLKKRFPLKEAILALCFPLTSLVGIYAVNSFAAHAFFAGCAVGFLVYMMEPVIADSTDIEEDQSAGVKTLASVLTWKGRVRMFVVGPVILTAALLIAYNLLGFNNVVPIYAVVGGIIFLGYLIPKMRTFEKEVVQRARNAAHLYFILLQVSFIVGSVQF